MDSPTRHVPILVEPIIRALIGHKVELAAEERPWIVDCTLGGGGHSQAILRALADVPECENHAVLSLDQDPEAVARGRQRFADEIAHGRLEIAHVRFGEAGDLLRSRPVVGLMADLGFSSDQLENPDRGISFLTDGPLDMRLDPTRGQSCLEYLRNVREPELADVIHELGEERFARRIAGAIIAARREKSLPRTTRELSELIVRTVPPPARFGRIHAATRTFQALRIVVNQELEELDSLLNDVMLSVRPGGRIAILSFHSLEDRRVKHAFKELPGFRPLTKKPVEASEEELGNNPRARSAKLRIAERTS